MDDDPSLARLLAAAAVRTEVNPSSTSALYRARDADLSVSRLRSTARQGVVWGELSPAGDLMILAGATQEAAGSELEMVETMTGRRVWSVDLLEETGEASAFVAQPRFSLDGETVVIGVFWDPQNIGRVTGQAEGTDEPPPDLLGIHIRDARTGALLRRLDLGRCGGLVTAIAQDRALVRTVAGPPEAVTACDWSVDTAVEAVTLSTGDRKPLATIRQVQWHWSGSIRPGGALTPDGHYAAYDDGPGKIVVRDLDSGEVVFRRLGVGVRAMTQDATLLLVGDRPMQVWDVKSGETVAEFNGHQGLSEFARFGSVDDHVYSTGDDGRLRVWDPRTGSELWSYPSMGNGYLSLAEGGLVAVAEPERGTVTVLDTEQAEQLDGLRPCDGSTPWESLTVVGSTAVFPVICGPSGPITFIVDITEGTVVSGMGGPDYWAISVSPDGKSLVRYEGDGGGDGVMKVRELSSGAELVELSDPCAAPSTGDPPFATACETQGQGRRVEAARASRDDFPPGAWQIRWSPDGSMIAATMGGAGVGVWDGQTGAVLFVETPDRPTSQVIDLIFTPDDSRLIVTDSHGYIRAISTETWVKTAERSLSVEGATHLGLAGFDPSGSTLYAVGPIWEDLGGSLHWLDAATLMPIRSRRNIHDGAIHGVALHRDGMRLATSAADGYVRVWDLAEGELVHEIPFGSRMLQGVAFVGESQLAITTEDGALIVLSTDPNDLIADVGASLTRGLTATECANFNFDDDCPTLSDLRGLTGPALASGLDGQYRIRWLTDELAEVMVEALERKHGGLTPETSRAVEDLADDYAGTYTFSLNEGRFDVFRDDREESWCTGTYRFEGGRVWLASERGWGCMEVRWFDAALDLAGESLRFDAGEFRGTWQDRILFTTKPLEEVADRG